MHATVAVYMEFLFFFNDTATTEIYTLSLHDALPIWRRGRGYGCGGLLFRLVGLGACLGQEMAVAGEAATLVAVAVGRRSEEHTSELQSRQYLVCRLLLEKKKKNAELSCTLDVVSRGL